MKTSFACTLSLVALAGLAGCANPSDEPTPEGASSDIVGVTDLTEMEAALGLEKDVKLPNGQWSRGDDKLKAGACWKSRFASADHDASTWEFRRYKNGAAFFRKAGVGALEGDQRAVRCVDVDVNTSGAPETFAFEGLALDVVVRSKLGAFQGASGGAGHEYMDFARMPIAVQDADHLCGFHDLSGHEASIDPALRAGSEAMRRCGGPDVDCAFVAIEACKLAFAADAQGDGSIDRPAFSGLRFLETQDGSIDPSVAAFAYRYAQKTNTDAKAFSMSTDPIGTYRATSQRPGDTITSYEKMEVHHLTRAGVEGLYLTAPNQPGNPKPSAKASCERRLGANGQPVTGYACSGL